MKEQAIVAKTEMLIRKPIADVFEAFTNPAVTSKFWFSAAAIGLKPAKRYAGIGRCTTFQSKRK